MTSDQLDPKEDARRLLGYLRRLKGDRGAMADLRCALNPTRVPRAWPWLGAVSGIGNQRIETIAGLYAYHPEETHSGNVGTTCRRLAGENNTFDGRFRRLLSCDRDEICDRLRPVILTAKAKEIPVNYEQLIADLRFWGDRVKTQWAQEYWAMPKSEEAAIGKSSETLS